MQLVYWVATCMNDSSCYSLRAKTKKACQELLTANYCPSDYEKPKKVTIEYADGFDLMEQCLSEFRGGE